VPETTYVVLRQTESASGWDVIASSVNASNAESAIRSALAATVNPADGSYVATPKRSWKPLTVSAVQTTVLKLEAPSA
jgi:hypothetical protein